MYLIVSALKILLIKFFKIEIDLYAHGNKFEDR